MAALVEGLVVVVLDVVVVTGEDSVNTGGWMVVVVAKLSRNRKKINVNQKLFFLQGLHDNTQK